jgi:protein-tyrosine-phosphatase
MRQVIVFVCEHGAAKSVVAAAWLGRLAADARVPLEAVARGTEPDPEVSPIAVAGLSADGLPVPLRAPQRVVPGELRWASRVVSFGPDLGGLAPGVPVEAWQVPAVSDDYDAARDAIVAMLRARLLGATTGD